MAKISLLHFSENGYYQQIFTEYAIFRVIGPPLKYFKISWNFSSV